LRELLSRAWFVSLASHPPRSHFNSLNTEHFTCPLCITVNISTNAKFL
jgi:hypothetical protein